MGNLLSTYLGLPLGAPFKVDLVWGGVKEGLNVSSQGEKGSIFQNKGYLL